MMHCYTSNQIIQYLYNELPAVEYLETEDAIKHVPEWRDKYSLLKEAFQMIPRVHFFPKRRILKSILEYSQTVA